MAAQETAYWRDRHDNPPRCGPSPAAGAFDWVSAIIALAAAAALPRYRRTVIEVIVACGLLGLLLSGVNL
ncbi:MAG: hypothetical protein NFCOHLIN_00871 [Gammaproteobacteria bacterium]|nr:hypothetical protein [Gammaproteobacteria bacterium]